MTKFFPLSIETSAEVRIAFRRLQNYLLLPEVAPLAALPAPPTTTGGVDDVARVHIHMPAAASAPVPNGFTPATVTAGAHVAGGSLTVTDLCCSWEKEVVDAAHETPQPHPHATSPHEMPNTEPTRPLTLSHVSLHVPAAELCAVIGPVGSGKTSLLMAVLNELQPKSGRVACSGRIAYVPQTAWIMTYVILLGKLAAFRAHVVPRAFAHLRDSLLFAPLRLCCRGTVRDNITFGLDFDEARYNAVVAACCLQRDLATFANGDQEVIGERGINLSGGYVRRVALLTTRRLCNTCRAANHIRATMCVHGRTCHADSVHGSPWLAPAT
ncbi:MAG: ATP-binding cassette domain-containing protein [Methanosarcinales archaeon]|nr:MAG: ATP-binding cassette domain-containing protein [Methanosarcinales archaeon]